MTASLAHLHALAQRALDAHERRAGELRGRLAPVLAAGVAATALLTPQALAALRIGAPASAAALAVTITAAFATVFAIGRFLRADLTSTTLSPAPVQRYLTINDALEDERIFHEAMTSLIGAACEKAERQVEALRLQFTAIMCGILFVLCGLAFAAAVAW